MDNNRNIDIINPSITVIIPVQNEDKFIRACLDAVKKQDYPGEKLKIIVVDNGSTDKTVDFVKNYNDVILLNKREGTIGSLRNFGAWATKSELIAFLDGDCVAPRNWLLEGVRMLREDGISCVGFKSGIPNTHTWVTRTWHKISSGSNYKGTQYVKWLSSFNIIIKRNYFESVSGFNEGLETCEDADLGYRLNKISKLIYSDKLEVVHLGVVTTLVQFFIKEMWRGKNNLTAFFSSSQKLTNIGSVFFPLFFFMSIVLSPVSLFYSQKMFLLNIFFLILFPLAMTTRKTKLNNIKNIFSTLFLCSIYLFARGLAFFKK